MQKLLASPQAVRLVVQPGDERDYEMWRWSINNVFDIDTPDRGGRAAFGLTSEAYGLDRLRISNTRCGALRMMRDERVIARAGIDSYMCILYRTGGVRYRAGAREGVTRIGDALLLDLSRPCELEGGEHHADSFVFHRADVSQVTGAEADLHGLLLNNGDPLAEIFKAAAWAALAEAPRLQGAAAEAASLGLAALIAHCFAPGVRAGPAGQSGLAHAAFRRARLEIERNLCDLNLGVDMLARNCGLSRSTLYRLFEPHGGVAAYIRRARLARARDLLAAAGPVRIGEVARDCGFEDVSVFGRRFREAFAISPRDFREAVRLNQAAFRLDEHVGDSAFQSVVNWFQFEA